MDTCSACATAGDETHPNGRALICLPYPNVKTPIAASVSSPRLSPTASNRLLSVTEVILSGMSPAIRQPSSCRSPQPSSRLLLGWEVRLLDCPAEGIDQDTFEGQIVREGWDVVASWSTYLSAIEDVAAEHFGLRVSEGRVRHLLRMLISDRTNRGVLATLQSTMGDREALRDAIFARHDAEAAANAFFDEVATWRARPGNASGRMIGADLFPNPLTPALKKLASALKLLRAETTDETTEMELGSLAGRAAEIAEAASMLVDQAIEGCVYWVDTTPGRRGGRDRGSVTLACAAVDVAPILREHLFGREGAVVCTSATLATGAEDFSLATSRLGAEDAQTLQVGSPFDFARQMRVLVDPHLPDPRDAAYQERLVDRIVEQVRETDGGAFVLFTSNAAMTEAAARSRARLEEAGHQVLVQHETGPMELVLQRFREDDRAVLFGVSTFWQGVDVRGQGLRNVIITRLPFDVPDRPIVQARHEMIEERGGRPFFEDQVPRAVIRFKQGVGRLIRSADDAGRVVVLDPRIVTKGYGRAFQAALPEGVEVEPLEPPAVEVDDYNTFDDWVPDDSVPDDGGHPGGFDAIP